MRKRDERSNKPAHERETESETSRRYRLQPDEVGMLEQFRRIKDEAEAAGVDPETVKSGWIKSDAASLYFKNPNYKTPEQIGFENLQGELLKEFKEYSPKYPTIKRKKTDEGHLLVVDPADIHIGKLCTAYETGTDYNQNIAVKRVLEGVKGLLDKSNGFNIDKILFVAGNDILHTDNAKRQTTAGTSQDTDGMWYDNFLTAKRLYVDIIEMLMQVADVEMVFNPSNHDYQSGFFLAQTIEAHFHKSKNVTFNCSIAHRKYSTYGNSLIGTTHGDGARQTDLGSLMSIEAKEHWATSEHRYFYTHHVHHKSSKDFINVSVETLRSPSPADSWHDRNGYKSKEAVEAFIHSKENGQVARLTHYF
jgi:hypothetical protein